MAVSTFMSLPERYTLPFHGVNEFARLRIKGGGAGCQALCHQAYKKDIRNPAGAEVAGLPVPERHEQHFQDVVLELMQFRADFFQYDIFHGLTSRNKLQTISRLARPWCFHANHMISKRIRNY